MSKERERQRMIWPAMCIKLHNRRVIANRMGDGTVIFKFRILEGGEIHSQAIRLSREALGAVCAIAQEMGVV